MPGKPAPLEHGWNVQQVKLFAKRFASSAEARAWWSFVPSVRNALLTHYVMQIVSSNERETTVAEMIALRKGVEVALRLYQQIYVNPEDES